MTAVKDRFVTFNILSRKKTSTNGLSPQISFFWRQESHFSRLRATESKFFSRLGEELFSRSLLSLRCNILNYTDRDTQIIGMKIIALSFKDNKGIIASM